MCVFWEGKLSLCVSIYLFQNILKSKNKVWQKWQLLLENSSGKANPLRAVGILRQLCFPSRGGIRPGISFLVPTAEAPAGPSPENCSGRGCCLRALHCGVQASVAGRDLRAPSSAFLAALQARVRGTLTLKLHLTRPPGAVWWRLGQLETRETEGARCQVHPSAPPAGFGSTRSTGRWRDSSRSSARGQAFRRRFVVCIFSSPSPSPTKLTSERLGPHVWAHEEEDSEGDDAGGLARAGLFLAVRQGSPVLLVFPSCLAIPKLDCGKVETCSYNVL